MSSQSLFGRLTRFAYNARRQPKEERLTEAFAATLHSSQGATVDLLRGLGISAGSKLGPFDVVTQRYTTAGDRVDVEVRFGPAARPTAVVWLELKWDAKPDPDQLRKYDRALKAMPWPTGLASIAPYDACFDADVPGVHETWQRAAVLLASWLDNARSTHPIDHGAAMVGAFVDYLEENDLAMTGAFTLADALALSNIEVARRRIAEVVARAHVELERGATLKAVPGSDDEDGWTHRTDPMDFWRTYDTPEALAANPQKRWFEFHGRKDDNRSRPQGETAFGAGLTSTEADAFDESYAEWLAEMQAKGFEYGGDGEHMYLFRYRYPAELVAGADIDEQGRLLADWVLETFALLEANPPPISD